MNTANYTYTCQKCGKEGTDQKHKNRKYCSQKCFGLHKKKYDRRIRIRYKTIPVTCITCGKQFKTFQNHPGKFCSEQCRHPSRIQRKNDHWIDVTCKYCGRTFQTMISRPKIYCGWKCFNEKKHENIVDLICKQCGKEYKTKASQIKAHGSNFCSRECRWTARITPMMGSNNPHYRGGTHKFFGPHWGRQKRKAKQRDGYHCQVCGLSDKKKLDVHHIVPRRIFNVDWDKADDLSNLITLCGSCHQKVENEKIPCPVIQSQASALESHVL